MKMEKKPGTRIYTVAYDADEWELASRVRAGVRTNGDEVDHDWKDIVDRDAIQRMVDGWGVSFARLNNAPFFGSDTFAEEVVHPTYKYFAVRARADNGHRMISLVGPRNVRMKSGCYDLSEGLVRTSYLWFVPDPIGGGAAAEIADGDEGWVRLTFSGGRSWVYGEFEFTTAREKNGQFEITGGSFSCPNRDTP